MLSKYETSDLRTELTEFELSQVNGGVVLATIAIGGTVVTVTGKMAVGAIAGATATGYWFGRGLGYF